MSLFCKRALWPLHILLCCSVAAAIVNGESTEHTTTSFTTVATTEEERKATTTKGADQMVNDAFQPNVVTATKTHVIIMGIVRRTVDRYMEVMQTRPDWQARLLQLVRKERELRSKNNCSTDVCIHKIQLFKHLLQRRKREEHQLGKRRRRRSVDSLLPEKSSGGANADTSVDHPNLEQDNEGLPRRKNDETSDALRLPEPLPLPTKSDHEGDPLPQEIVSFQGMIGQNNHAQRNPSSTKAFFKQLKRPMEEEVASDNFLESTKKLPPLDISAPVLKEKKPTQPAKLPDESDRFVPAKQFVSNVHSRRHHENCTVNDEHHCIFAVKCLYISLLETAVCYCKPGYTGVRCDEYNLPENFDNWEPYKGNIVSINQLIDNAALYSAMEATAYYTVNAVLEDGLVTLDEEPY